MYSWADVMTMEMFFYLAQGLTLGFAAAIQPGPFQTYLITRSLENGWRRTLLAALAPLLSDGPIIALVLLVISQVPPWFQGGLSLAGGVFVLYLAWGAYRSWQANSPSGVETGRGRTRSLFRAALTNALSPGPYLFWSLVTGPIFLQGWLESPVNGLGFLLGFYAAMIGLNAVIIVLFGLTGQIGDRVRRAMLGISVVALAGFGLYQLWRGVSAL